jgi:hypothetical protein
MTTKTRATVHVKTFEVTFAMTRAFSVMNAPFGSPSMHMRRLEDSELHRVEGMGTFHPGASRNERERSNEERIANGWFTSRGVGGSVTARQDGWRTTNTLATVHGKTFDVPFDGVQLVT